MIGPCSGRPFMGTSELYKHGKCNVKWIDTYNSVNVKCKKRGPKTDLYEMDQN